MSGDLGPNKPSISLTDIVARKALRSAAAKRSWEARRARAAAPKPEAEAEIRPSWLQRLWQWVRP